MYIALIIIALLGLGGCGKTFDKSLKAGHALLDIAAGVYEDTKDNVYIVINEFKNPVPPPTKK